MLQQRDFREHKFYPLPCNSVLQSDMSIGLFLMTFVVDIVTVSTDDIKSFTLLTFAYGTRFCAVNSPSAVVLTSDVLGISDGVGPPSVTCGLSCSSYSGCVGYNYRQLPIRSPADGQCELYTFTPSNCTTIDDNCEYYEVSEPNEFIN
jgi:hypothetical protein